MLSLKKLEERAKKPELSVLEKAQIAKELQDLPITDGVAGKAKADLYTKFPFLNPERLLLELGNIIFMPHSKTVIGLKKLFDDIGEIQNLGLFSSEKDVKKLASYRESVSKAFVEASVDLLEADAGMGLMPETDLGKELATRMEELETTPEFKRVLLSNPKVQARYQKVVQERAAQSKNPEKALQTARKFLEDPKRCSTIRDFESLAADLAELNVVISKSLRASYEKFKEEFLRKLRLFITTHRDTLSEGDIGQGFRIYGSSRLLSIATIADFQTISDDFVQLKESLPRLPQAEFEGLARRFFERVKDFVQTQPPPEGKGNLPADSARQLVGIYETFRLAALDGPGATFKDFTSFAEDLEELEEKLPGAVRASYKELAIKFLEKMSTFVQRLDARVGVDRLLSMAGQCHALMDYRSFLCSEDIPSKEAVNALVREMTAMASSLDSTVPVQRLRELRDAFSSLQPETGGARTTCLTIEQNKRVEIAKQRLTILIATRSEPLSLKVDNDIHELAFAVSFLTRNSPEEVEKLQPKIGMARAALQKTFQAQLARVSMSDDDKTAIVRVLSWDPNATMADVATLVRNKDKLPRSLVDSFPQKTVIPNETELFLGEAILEFINAVRLDPSQRLSVEDFQVLEKFFESLNRPDLQSALIRSVGGRPTNFRLKQQAAERTIWEHRPEDLSGVRDIGAWYKRQKESSLSDEASMKKLRPFGQQDTTETLQAKPVVQELPQEFREVNSKKLAPKKPDSSLPTTLMSSNVVPPALLQHLLRDQVDAAVSRKAAPGSGDRRIPPWLVTNVESIAGVFCTEFGVGEASASIFHQWAVDPYKEGLSRRVIVARNVHPDAEAKLKNTSPEGTVPVFLMLAALGDERLQGEKLPDDFKVPSIEERMRWTDEERQEYDSRLLKHYTFFLYPDGVRPAKSDIPKNDILTMDEANKQVEGLIASGASPEKILEEVRNKYINVDGRLVSLGVYFLASVHQTRHILAIGEAIGPYTCPLTPPLIFALKNGDPTFHSRLQCLAFQFIRVEKFSNLKVLAPSTFVSPGVEDREIVGLYKKVFEKKTDTKVLSLSQIYNSRGQMDASKIQGALIQPTNSDALGDNYNSEGQRSGARHGGSLEAVVGKHVRAGFDPGKPDRMRCVYYV